jgi:phosphate transport system substrate-binding protein
MMKAKFIFLLSAFFVLSCQKKLDTPSYNKGSITIETDESFQSVTESLADTYMINYPKTKISVVTRKEDLAFLDLLQKKVRLIVMSRDLSNEEKKEYEKQIESKFLPAKFAADAVVFVVPNDSPKNSISMDEIKEGLNSEQKNFIFDGTNSSNLNFVAQTIGKKPADLKFSIINGNANVIEELKKYPDKIGVIGLNTLSRPFGEEAKKLRALVKILPVTLNEKSIEPDIDHIKTMQYPFTRVIYFLTSKGNFNLANGIIRFSCTQLGQLVVEKEGLQPYNLYEREVQMR